MKKLSIIAIVAIVSASGAWAEVAMVTTDETGCYVRNANLEPALIPLPLLGGDGVVQPVITPNGKVKFTCSSTLPEGAVPAMKGAFVITGEDTISLGEPEGLPCLALGYFLKLDGYLVVTKSGRASLSSDINGND